MDYSEIAAYNAVGLVAGYALGWLTTRKKKEVAPIRYVDVGGQHGNANFTTKNPTLVNNELRFSAERLVPTNTIADHLEAKEKLELAKVTGIYKFNEDDPSSEPILHPRKKHRKPRHSNRKRS